MRIAAWLLVLAISGCLAGDGSPEVAGAPEGFVPLEGSMTRSLEAPPEWATGEWWTYDIKPFWGTPMRVTRVVVGAVGDHYLVGMPTEEFHHADLLLHLPGFGEVGRSDLSFEVHDDVFRTAVFPLREGSSWPVSFETTPGMATVSLAGAGQADIHFAVPGNDDFTLHYDAPTGDFVRMTGTTYAAWTLSGHGTRYQGRVTVPLGADLVFYNGSCAVALDAHCQEPGGDSVQGGTVEVEGDYDCATFVLAPQDSVPPSLPVFGERSVGAYSIQVTSPAGHEFSARLSPGDAARQHWAAHAEPEPTGTWTVESVAAGGGRSLFEGVAYRSYTFDLEEGRVVTAARGEPMCAPPQPADDG